VHQCNCTFNTIHYQFKTNRNNIIIRHATKSTDLKQIKHLFKVVFGDEGVDKLAEIFHKHFPNWKPDYWFLAEDTVTQQIISGFCLIPWKWNFNSIMLNVAEMGLVATLPDYRGKGLMKLLNAEFNKYIEENGFHLAAIQGIPGFYNKFEYHYALPMERHVIMPLDKNFPSTNNYGFSEAGIQDIPFLMEQDDLFKSSFDISANRNKATWEYLLSHSKKTEYGSEFWIIEDKLLQDRYYFRIALQGFGSGLVISEISENMPLSALSNTMAFLINESNKRNKPFIRFNISHDLKLSKQLLIWGAEKGKSYAWQIKIQDAIKFLDAMRPVFENRIALSSLKGFSGLFHLNMYYKGIDLIWKNGKIIGIKSEGVKEVENMLNVCADLFILLCLGHKTWEELQQIRPDIFPGDLYFDPTVNRVGNVSRELTDILFPKTKSWINCQY
jgi:GNAT superfamily N-acetyltransferase